MENKIEKNKTKFIKDNYKKITYYITTSILLFFVLFILITIIIQTSMVGINNVDEPILIWIVSLPNVGSFFLPISLLLCFVCWFLTIYTRPPELSRTKEECDELFRLNKLTQEEYEIILRGLRKAIWRSYIEKDDDKFELEDEIDYSLDMNEDCKINE